jgi:coenzyme PQQ precursor peptide PqqA
MRRVRCATARHGSCEDREERSAALAAGLQSIHTHKETVMQWSKPEFIDFRFGFEITLYVFNR